MYSHLSASVAAERTDDDVYRAHLHRRARQAATPSTLEITTSTTPGSPVGPPAYRGGVGSAGSSRGRHGPSPATRSTA